MSDEIRVKVVPPPTPEPVVVVELSLGLARDFLGTDGRRHRDAERRIDAEMRAALARYEASRRSLVPM